MSWGTIVPQIWRGGSRRLNEARRSEECAGCFPDTWREQQSRGTVSCALAVSLVVLEDGAGACEHDGSRGQVFVRCPCRTLPSRGPVG
eukprot:2989663-Rhodomonas_salina.1